MSTYTQIIYQIVFGTKNNVETLSKDNRSKLFEYTIGILLNNKCHVYCINGVEDHIHIVCQIHPTVGLAWLIKDIKLATSAFIKEENCSRILWDGKLDMVRLRIRSKRRKI